MFSISSFNVLSKATIFTAYCYGLYAGCSALNANKQAWDVNELKLAKRLRDVRAAAAPKAVATSDAPLELAPGVPLPAELADAVKALRA